MRVAVLGAGLQGCCVAMDLADVGIQVDLYDRNSECMTQASLHNEGKIHLGYVYANDPSMRSARAMAEGAATFGPLLEKWLETPMSRWGRSTTFNYAVHRDSILTPTEFESYMLRAHELANTRIYRGDYFGVDISKPPEQLSPAELEADYDPAAVQAVYRTGEISIDPRRLALAVRDRIGADSRIRTILDTEVHGVSAADDRIAVEFTNGEARSSVEYDQIVNALWDGRLAVDATVGLTPEHRWLFRVKHYLMVESGTVRLPSTTIVLGPFGDIVDYDDGTFYLSWYPSGLQGASTDLELPDWLRNLPEAAVDETRAGIFNGLASVVPRLADMPIADMARAELAGGVIFAWGETDIDDHRSGLHERFAIGPRSTGRYHSVDTGKLTTAPLHARVVAERVKAAR